MAATEHLGADTDGFSGRELQQSDRRAIQFDFTPTGGHQAVARMCRSIEQQVSQFVRDSVPQDYSFGMSAALR